MGTVLFTGLLLIVGFVVVLVLGMHGQARAYEHRRQPTQEPRDMEDQR
jgi:hypothetical protein